VCYVFSEVFKQDLGPTQLVEWVPRDSALGLMWPGYEADRSPPSCTQVSNDWNCTSTAALPHMPGTFFTFNFNIL